MIWGKNPNVVQNVAINQNVMGVIWTKYVVKRGKVRVTKC